MFIHRAISKYLYGSLDIEKTARLAKRAAEQSSDTEAAAAVAERDYVDYKACEFMADKVGQRFGGVISSVTSFGFFVELPNTVEGLVRMSDLDDDYYIFDEENMILYGEHSGIVYKIGDRADVILAKVNTELKQIDFVPYKETKPERGAKKHGTGSKHKRKTKRKSRRSK